MWPWKLLLVFLTLAMSNMEDYITPEMWQTKALAFLLIFLHIVDIVSVPQKGITEEQAAGVRMIMLIPRFCVLISMGFIMSSAGLTMGKAPHVLTILLASVYSYIDSKDIHNRS